MTIIDTSQFFRIKAATQDLVDRCGGIERAAAKCAYSKSQVGRWVHRDHHEIISLSAVLVLEADAGEPYVTRAMAAIAGLETSPRPDGGISVISAYVDLAAKAGAVHTEMGEALSDGVITATEQHRIERAASGLDSATEHFRESLAATGGTVIKLGA